MAGNNIDLYIIIMLMNLKKREKWEIFIYLLPYLNLFVLRSTSVTVVLHMYIRITVAYDVNESLIFFIYDLELSEILIGAIISYLIDYI